MENDNLTVNNSQIGRELVLEQISKQIDKGKFSFCWHWSDLYVYALVKGRLTGGLSKTKTVAPQKKRYLGSLDPHQLSNPFRVNMQKLKTSTSMTT